MAEALARTVLPRLAVSQLIERLTRLRTDLTACWVPIRPAAWPAPIKTSSAWIWAQALR